jgi:mannose-1-phosphate guanylyltransferase
LEKNVENNAMVNGRLLAEDAQGNMIRTNAGKLVVIDGLQDYIVVDKDEVLMIYPKAKEQDIKKVVSKVRDAFGDELV